MSSRVTPGRSAADGIDVAGHGHVDDEQRRDRRGSSITRARSPCSSMIERGAGGGEQQVDLGQRRVEVGQAHGPAADPRRPARPPAPRCGWRCGCRSTPAGGQRADHALAHVAGAEHEDARGRSSEPRRSAAMATAAVDTDAMWRAMPVSVRARLPTSSAWRNSRLSGEPAVPFLLGPLPRLADLAEDLGLADTAESSPAATANRWATASSSYVDVEVVGEAPRAAGRPARTRKLRRSA